MLARKEIGFGTPDRRLTVGSGRGRGEIAKSRPTGEVGKDQKRVTFIDAVEILNDFQLLSPSAAGEWNRAINANSPSAISGISRVGNCAHLVIERTLRGQETSVLEREIADGTVNVTVGEQSGFVTITKFSKAEAEKAEGTRQPDYVVHLPTTDETVGEAVIQTLGEPAAPLDSRNEDGYLIRAQRATADLLESIEFLKKIEGRSPVTQ
jgi:hypothetical protein